MYFRADETGFLLTYPNGTARNSKCECSQLDVEWRQSKSPNKNMVRWKYTTTIVQWVTRTIKVSKVVVAVLTSRWFLNQNFAFSSSVVPDEMQRGRCWFRRLSSFEEVQRGSKLTSGLLPPQSIESVRLLGEETTHNAAHSDKYMLEQCPRWATYQQNLMLHLQ